MQKQTAPFRKDESLNRLAESINVAQFVSFLPGHASRQAYSRVLGYAPNHKFKSVHAALTALYERSSEHSINVRSFRPDDPRSHEFIYGLKSVDDAMSAVSRIAVAGFHVIVNETIDVKDGGVSGVIQGDVIEFAPDDTPRCVEKPGVASLPRNWGLRILSTVYNFVPELNVPRDFRLEFSIHPRPRGWKYTHTIGWELEKVGRIAFKPKTQWPNQFSRMLGDKVFGLLISHQIGLPVPKTTVVARRIAPFSFGVDSGTAECWIRTSPREQMPGKFTTHRGWIDPFLLLANEDPDGTKIASVIAQQGVRPEFSGALIVQRDGTQKIEGKAGEGESLMRGMAVPEPLPKRVESDVRHLFKKAAERLGAVRFEWVHDGRKAWIVQLHRGATQSIATVLVPGEAEHWRSFEVKRGLEALRVELDMMNLDEGIRLIGQVGLTSHIADVIRRAGKPARISADPALVDHSDDDYQKHAHVFARRI